MSKQVIVGKEVSSGRIRVFSDLDSASGEIGMSIGMISRCCSEGRECHGWVVRRVERVYAVRRKGERTWSLVSRDGRNTGYIILGDPSGRIRDREVEQVREITSGWYFGT